MPIYYFDLMEAGVSSSLGDGVEFSSDELAREYALGIVSTFRSGDRGCASERVSIRDEAGAPIDEVGRDGAAGRSKHDQRDGADRGPPDAEQFHDDAFPHPRSAATPVHASGREDRPAAAGHETRP